MTKTFFNASLIVDEVELRLQRLKGRFILFYKESYQEFSICVRWDVSVKNCFSVKVPQAQVAEICTDYEDPAKH
jgi:hypothetical protein